MTKAVVFSSLVEANGRTIRENNLEVRHKISIGTLVQFRYSEWFEGGACRRSEARMFVCWHARDCDGTPLYWLATKPPHLWLQDGGVDPNLVFPGLTDRCQHYEMANRFYKFVRNIGEEDLTPIEVTAELVSGVGALDWDLV